MGKLIVENYECYFKLLQVCDSENTDMHIIREWAQSYIKKNK